MKTEKSHSEYSNPTRRQFLQLVALTGGMVFTGGCGLSAFAEDTPRDNWGLKPLGPDVSPLQWKPAANKRPLKSNFTSQPASGKVLLLARDSQPLAALVIPNDNKTIQEVAVVLQRILEKISGAKIPIVVENTLDASSQHQTLVSLGATELAQKAGINAADLQPEGYRLRTVNNMLFITGNDRGKGVTVHGTRNGVYALLERHFGCRWLWAGELGEVYPRKSTLILNPINEQDEPALEVHNLRNSYPGAFYNNASRLPNHQHKAALARLGRSEESFVQKTTGSGTWFEAMALGQSFNLQYKHAYGTMWDKYGKTHPEYFALQPDGTRNQSAAPHQARLDVSNDALIKTIAADIIHRFEKDADLASLSISPNDGGPTGFCMCEVCRRLDPPNAPPVTLNLGDGHRTDKYVSLSDRYVTFYAKIAEIVQKKFPDRKLGAYAYSAYKTPPLYATLPSNVIVGFVGLGYLGEEGRQNDLQNWDLWTRAASHLMLRPNALGDGLGFPVLYPHRLGEDIRHCYQTGMMGGDFDSVQHNWAGQGLNYYVLAKLLWDPSQDIDALIKDYCDAGFGAASPAIQKYFSLQEKLTTQMAQNPVDWDYVSDAVANRTLYRKLHVLVDCFTDSNLDQLQNLLDEAKTQAGPDEIVLKRIEFLEQALRYARAEARPARLFLKMISDASIGADPANRQQLMKYLQERETVFQDIYDHHFYTQSLINTVYREGKMWQTFGWEYSGADG